MSAKHVLDPVGARPVAPSAGLTSAPEGRGVACCARCRVRSTSPISTHPSGALALRAYFLLNLLTEFVGRTGKNPPLTSAFPGGR
jgi:hypothetical protein